MKLKQLIEQIVREELGSILEGPEQRQAFAQDLRDRNIPPEKISWAPRPGLNASENEDVVLRDMMRLGRPIKQLFHKHADHQWLSTLTTVHFSTVPDLRRLLDKGSSRDELSAIAFLPGQFSKASIWDLPIGLVVKGRITLLANDMDKVHTDAGARYTQADPKRTKMSGANKGVRQIFKPEVYERRKLIVLDKDEWKPKMHFLKGGMINSNEALVDNWKPVAIVVYPDPDWDVESVSRHLTSQGYDIPIMSYHEAQKVF